MSAEDRPTAATMVDAAAYHGPLSTSFQERRRVAEVSESEFEPEDSWGWATVAEERTPAHGVPPMTTTLRLTHESPWLEANGVTIAGCMGVLRRLIAMGVPGDATVEWRGGVSTPEYLSLQVMARWSTPAEEQSHG